jgi:hypothetical protein
MDYRFNKTLLVILSLSSLLLSSNAVPSTRVAAPAQAPKVAKVVTKVDFIKLCSNKELRTYETYCIETFSKLFQGPNFDIAKAVEIVEIEANASLGADKTIFDTIIKLRNDTTSTNKNVIHALENCIKLYDLIVYQVNRAALELLPQHNFGDAMYMMSVLGYNGDCQGSWEEYNPGVEMLWDAKPLIMSSLITMDVMYYIVENQKF